MNVSDDGLEWPEVLGTLLAGEALTEDRAAEIMGVVMRGEAEPTQIAALLIALRAKGEAGAELAGFVRAMLGAAEPISIDPEVAGRLVDVVGTGGDGAQTFNISTLAALVVAACGQPVAKHGNRAASGRCGSADLLEAWGIPIELPATGVARCIEEVGIGFLYARTFHPAMRVVGPVRQQLGVPTTFNVLGPLSNPARVPSLAVGVADARLAPVMAAALARLGKRALVFRGEDGLDELTTTGPSRVWEVIDRQVHERTIDPRDLSIQRARADQLRGGAVDDNVRIADEVLTGAPGPRTEVVVLNAAAGLYVAGAVDTIADGVVRARQALADGSVADLKERWQALARRLAEVPTEG